jgi:hypothetical protein
VPSRYRWDHYVLDLDAYRLERDGVAVALEPKAFNLLAVMVQRPGHLLTKQEIFDLVWPGTAVTDAGLDHLKGLPKLRNLYVWQTKVTQAGVDRLKQALPQVQIVTGWDTAAKAEAPKTEAAKP